MTGTASDRAIGRRAVVAGFGVASAAALVGAPLPVRAETPAKALADAVNRWLAALDDGQRAKARFPFADLERLDWHYVPRGRKGLALKDMTSSQRDRAMAVLRLGLSEAGYKKTTDIITLEKILGEIETFGFFRDPGKYYLTVFGTPGDGAWGWRFEGHHLSLNMTLRDGRLIAATPLFLGTNPAVVPVGHMKGMEVMGPEIKLARALLGALDGEQRQRALIADGAFGDIVAGPGREDSLKEPIGIAGADLAGAQRDVLIALVERYARNLPTDWAAEEMARVRAAGLDGLHFAWAGATEPGPGRGHYFRVHGPAVLIEYDNSRSDANHVHSVWHDPMNPFGRDVLGAHYRHGHRHV